MALTDERKLKVAQVIQELANQLNDFGTSPAEVAEAIVDQLFVTHRTLQQGVIGAFKVAIESYADKCVEHRFYDLRNDAAVSWAREVGKIQGGKALDAGTIKNWIFSPGQGFPLV